MNDEIENWIDDKKRHQDSDSLAKCILVVDLDELIELAFKKGWHSGWDLSGEGFNSEYGCSNTEKLSNYSLESFKEED